MLTLFPIDKQIYSCITTLNIGPANEISCAYAVGTKDGETFTPLATQSLYIATSDAAPLLNQKLTEEEQAGSINQILYSRVHQFLKQRGDIKA
ncbi:hypothetical protein AA0N74_08110 [Chromobacterium vaccinii]|uniref:hypothetical protein n=1 Tax=Chromobacterium vaccinii TaxID=1108595 RepID=UPI0031D237EB